MKKILFLLAALPALCFAQKTTLQHAAYGGFDFAHSGDLVGYTNIGYDFRLRNKRGVPDFAFGTWLLANTSYSDYLGSDFFGTGMHGSMLLGKGAHSFELGVNGNIGVSTKLYAYDAVKAKSDYRLFARIMEVNPFIGYRYQPKNKRLFFEVQHTPFAFALNYNNSQNDIKIISPYLSSGIGRGFLLTSFGVKLGFNLNLLKDSTAAAPAAYEAPTSPKIELQHAFAVSLLDIMYDLRWRRADKTDFALDLAYTSVNQVEGYGYRYSAQALGILFEGNASMELGLMWEYKHLEHQYIGRPAYQSSTNLSFIGLPIGFRLQPRKGFFARCYAAPYKYISLENLPSNSPQLSEYKTGLDGIRLGIGLGYTF
jgi:hypothetical protein